MRFQQALQRLQIGVHQPGVAGEQRIVHIRLAEQGEDHLGAAPVGERAQRHVDHAAVRQRHPMIQHAEGIWRAEANADPPLRGVRHPVFIFSPQAVG